MTAETFDVQHFRSMFPYFGPDNPNPSICFDAVGGTQVPGMVIDAISDHLLHRNGNKGGIFRRSIETDDMMDATRDILAKFINADNPNEIVFGSSFTANTFNMSRSLARTWRPGDEIVVSRLDHDANVSPWLMAAEDAGVTVRHFDIQDGDCQLTVDNLKPLLNEHTKLVTFCAASSSVGTKPDVQALTEAAHETGALVYVDAVAYAPHDSIDVKKWDADFVGFSTYKFFGPHVSVLWGKQELLEGLPAYKIRPAPDTLPLKWLNGAQSYETIAGVKACIEYLGHVGVKNASYGAQFPEFDGVQKDLFAGMAAIKEYEEQLTWHFMDAIKQIGRYTVWGPSDIAQREERVPTVAVSLEGGKANDIAVYLADRNIDIWSRSVYSRSLSERIGLEQTGGFIRVGFAHYNTFEEVDRLTDALQAFEPQQAR